VEASWPPKKPGSYFRVLGRLFDLLVCWEKKRKKSGRNYT
jgi:hypothetical protein